MSSGESDPKISEPAPEKPPKDAGFIKFYGLYWAKAEVDWKNAQLLGQPKGWMGQGNTSKDFDPKSVQMNFWKQKGVYILYDSQMLPVYAGQAGLVRKKASKEGGVIGVRLLDHVGGIYRNGWSFFSWFGFMDVKPFNLRNAKEEKRMDPEWGFNRQSDSELNALLASFEAVLIEGFAPRFNARGGDLGKAILVDQYSESIRRA